MSILIKGMTMPENCAECPLLVNCDECEGYHNRCMPLGVPNGYSDYSGNDLTPSDKRRDDCPLVLVPPHGRLIDADALKAKQQEDADLFINAYTLMEKSRRDEALNAVANIVNAPTVIPAEEG